MVYINGEWINSDKQLDISNPATGEVIDSVYTIGQAETKNAINSAKTAFTFWKKYTGEERGRYLTEVARLMKKNLEKIAVTITTENGKPLIDSRGEVEEAISYMEWYAEESKRIYGDIIPTSDNEKRHMVFNEPIGVTAAITPWNFPLSMIARKIAPAIAAGCTIVLKPAPATPLSAINLFECFHEAGLPKGVVNLLIGPAEEIGAEMTSNPDVRKIAFTGSTDVGKKLIRDSADTVKKFSMELGGHAPLIIFEDADLEAAVEGVLFSKFKNAGQTCISANRIYVEESIEDLFVELLVKKVSELKIGNGMVEGIEIGPIINEYGLNKVKRHVEDAIKHNGKVLCGGDTINPRGLKGHFYLPTVIGDAHDQMAISREETFGPVAAIFSFKTEKELINRVNHETYGLAGYCFTKDLGRAYQMMEELDCGIVGINDTVPVTAQAPFGGFKESGIGKEGGKYGIDEYLEKKYVSIRIN